ncbi:unnamed protein product [Ectocarpus sp. CCAP 1310/34]|nr:unnamed protein product [Ectocarpus sp. CCAP 1310/34]
MPSTTEAVGVSSAASVMLLERAVWCSIVVVTYFRLNFRQWASDFWHQASAAEHKVSAARCPTPPTRPQGLFVSVVTLILTLYVLCIVAPMNAVAEWDIHWRGGSNGRRTSGPTRVR